MARTQVGEVDAENWVAQAGRPWNAVSAVRPLYGTSVGRMVNVVSAGAVMNVLIPGGENVRRLEER